MLLELIKIDRFSSAPLYRQLIDQTIQLVQNGVLMPGSQIPGTRKLAGKLAIHRKTVVTAIDELVTQGWLVTIPGRGTFVANEISNGIHQFSSAPGRRLEKPQIEIPTILDRDITNTAQKYHLDDGLPDPRLAPVDELMRAYKTALTKGWKYPKYTYGDPRGQLLLRQALRDYLTKTRGMQIGTDQILVTRGVTQALYLCIKAFIQTGDLVAIGALSWQSASINFAYHGAETVKIRVDAEGMDVDHLAAVCEQQPIKMVYVTPHHQYPTTVIMPAYRRVKLLQLARKYDFYVFEDDYDYDFHYSLHPIMPLAAAEHQQQVLYTGSLTKAISPVFRIGYLVASREQIDYLAKLRRLIDRQGDAILELAIAELLRTEVIQRFLRKNRKIYQHRRDYFGELLKNELGDCISFKLPEGGMSVWAQFKPNIDLKKLAREALMYELYFYDGAFFNAAEKINATRLGFASSTPEELQKSVDIIRKLLK